MHGWGHPEGRQEREGFTPGLLPLWLWHLRSQSHHFLGCERTTSAVARTGESRKCEEPSTEPQPQQHTHTQCLPSQGTHVQTSGQSHQLGVQLPPTASFPPEMPSR